MVCTALSLNQESILLMKMSQDICTTNSKIPIVWEDLQGIWMKLDLDNDCPSFLIIHTRLVQTLPETKGDEMINTDGNWP